jgi:hypothetical protein
MNENRDTKILEDLPYRIFYILCPACGEENSYERPKEGEFLFSSVEEDGHPAEFTATHPYLAHKNPLEFFWATCESCFFTAELDDEAFRTWKKGQSNYRDLFIKGALRQHAELVGRQEGLAWELGRVITEIGKPFETVFNKFLLGIYCETLKRSVSLYDMGRYYLRLGWVYRDRNGYVSRPGSRSNLLMHRETLEGAIGSLWASSIPEPDRFPMALPIPFSEADALRAAVQLFEESYSNSRNLSFEAEITIMSLIAELGYRLCFLDGAEEWLPFSMKYLSDSMGAAMRGSSDRSVDEKTRQKAKKLLDKISQQSEKFRELQRQEGDRRQMLLSRMRRGR